MAHSFHSCHAHTTVELDVDSLILLYHTLIRTHNSHIVKHEREEEVPFVFCWRKWSFDIAPRRWKLLLFCQVLAFQIKMNINANQAAQGANYAGRAMNAFQTAVDIDNQQPQTEGTTFWFRWLIRIVSVVTGIRAFFPLWSSLITFVLFQWRWSAEWSEHLAFQRHASQLAWSWCTLIDCFA